MRQNGRTNPNAAKLLARKKYAERQIDKWWKWSWEKRNRVKYKLFGIRTYEEPKQTVYVFYIPFVDIALEVYK